MAYDFDYAGYMTAIENLLRSDDRLEGAHITQEPESLTTEQCPGIILELNSMDRNPARIVAGVSAGNPENATVSVTIQCWEFSGQGAADAARKRDRLVQATVDVFRDNRDINAFPNVQWIEIPSIRFQHAPGQAGLYAVGVLTLNAFVMV